MSRLSCGRLKILAVAGAIALVLAAFGVPLTPPSARVHADGPGTPVHPAGPKKFALVDLINECGSTSTVAVATGNTFECDYITTATINAGGNLVLTITSPVGTVFAAGGVNPGSLPADCAAVVAPPPVLTISCALNHAAGLTIETVLIGGPAVPGGPNIIMMVASYNGGAPGPAFSFLYQFQTQTPPGPANVVSLAADPGTIGSIVCSNTSPGKVAASPFIVGDSFSCLVTFTAPNSASAVYVDNIGIPAGSAGYTLTGQQTDTFGFPYYTCGNAQTNTPCTTVAITGTANSTGRLAFDIQVANLGANNVYLPPTIFTPSTVPPVTGAGPGGAFVYAAGGLNTPVFGAIGCANSQNNLDIAFTATPTVIGGNTFGVLQGNNQITTSPPLPTPGSAPGALSVIAPTNAGNGFGAAFSAVECGAAFQDRAEGGPFFGQDADPDTIPGGTITYTLPNSLGFAQGGLGQILESNGNSYTIACGDAAPPAPNPLGPTFPNGLDDCQAAVPGPVGPGFPLGSSVSPALGNIVHVALRPNVSFSLIGGFAPVITITATYNRFLALAGIGVTGSGTLTTNSVAIGLTAPVYNLSLTPTPNTIPAALGSTTGSVITASLSRVVVAACAPLAAFGAFTICPVPGAVLALGLAVQTLTPGAEPGVVTFQTTSGVFGNPATVNAGSQQVASVHCGAAAGTAPVILTPQVGQLFQFSLTSCTSVSVTLFGGGAAGTAVVTATYVADYTGSTATAATTVTLSATAPTVTLTRGCNEVITGPTVAAAATSAIILALVSPSSAVVSIWQFNNSLHAFQAFYFSTAGAPLDINSVGPNQSLFICVSGTATFTTS